MNTKLHVLFLIVSGSILLLVPESSAQELQSKRHADVAMRMIGHQILLHSADSTSRVLPITMDQDRFKISFESEFAFHPGVLVSIVDSVMVSSKIAENYIVEVQKCNSDTIVYSYENNVIDDLGIIPCSPRDYPLGCYSILVSILDENNNIIALDNLATNSMEDLPQGTNQNNSTASKLLVIPLLLLVALFVFLWTRRNTHKIDPNFIPIGKYLFDNRNMKLILGKNGVELTSKESDLLTLLHSSANTTLERDVILNNVWGDEGDYVGRTLDVFISKLRKKLQDDPTIKIANIRGVGYKLILNDRE